MDINNPIIRRILESKLIEMQHEIVELQETLNGAPQRQKAAPTASVMRRRGRPMSDEEKRRVSLRMKRWWAARKRRESR
jgi:hypothetical protein